MFLEYQCAAMTLVEIRGVKVVTRDAPKIYKNCQRRSALRKKKISRQISAKYSSLLASSIRCGTIFRILRTGVTARHSPPFLALLGLEFATNDHSDVDTFFSNKYDATEKNIWSSPSTGSALDIQFSWYSSAARVSTFWFLCNRVPLRTPIFIVCKDNKYFFRNRPVRIQKKSINDHHFCLAPCCPLSSPGIASPSNAVDIIDVNRNKKIFFFFYGRSRSADLGWIIVALSTTRHVATYHAKVSS